MKLMLMTAALLMTPALVAADVSALLDQAAAVKQGDSENWIAARDAIVQLGEDAVPELAQAGAEANWKADGWVRAMVAEACRLRIEKPQVAAAVDKPSGLSPEDYKMFRKPEPACHRELRHLGVEAVPLLLERWRWTFESHTYSAGDAGKAERDCFARALLAVPGEVADKRARFAMEAALRDTALTETWRGDAAVSLGQTGGTEALAVLCELFDEAGTPLYIREACAWAMGRVAHKDAAQALSERLALEGQAPELQRALLNGVGILGNSWGWRARGVMHKQAGDEVRELCAQILVSAISTMPAEAEYIGRALGEVAWEASLPEVASLKQSGTTGAIREAAGKCLEPLKLAIDRAKK